MLFISGTISGPLPVGHLQYVAILQAAQILGKHSGQP